MSRSPVLSTTVELPPELVSEIRTGHARRGFLSKFERQVDPAGMLTPEERQRRADAALREHMSRLGQSSGQSRRARKVAADA